MINKIQKKIICKSPLIFTIDNFLSQSYCDYLKNYAKDKLDQSLVGKGDRNPVRTGTSCFLKKEDDKYVALFIEKISELLPKHLITIPNSISIIHYQLFQNYAYHLDAFNLDKNGNVISWNKKILNQRRFTAICYLNNVKKGGETRFHNLDINIKPEIGKLLIFKNVENNSDTPNKKSLHGGLPVIEGDKWLLNSWF